MTGAPTRLSGSVIGSNNEIAAVAAICGFTGNDIAIAVAVCHAESGGNALAISSANDFGAWQINLAAHGDLFAAHPSTVSWADPIINGNDAHTVWSNAGGKWTPWVTYNTGAYFPFLPVGQAAAAAIAGQNLANIAAPWVQLAQSAAGKGVGVTLQSTTLAATVSPADVYPPDGSTAVTNSPLVGAPAATPPTEDPLIRLLEIIMGAALLIVGLARLTKAPSIISTLGGTKGITKVGLGA